MSKLKQCKRDAKEYLKKLKKYPEKDISEYTRLVEALETFIEFGCWEEEDQE